MIVELDKLVEEEEKDLEEELKARFNAPQKDCSCACNCQNDAVFSTSSSVSGNA